MELILCRSPDIGHNKFSGGYNVHLRMKTNHTEFELTGVIKAVKCGKAAEEDEIRAEMLKSLKRDIFLAEFLRLLK